VAHCRFSRGRHFQCNSSSGSSSRSSPLVFSLLEGQETLFFQSFTFWSFLSRSSSSVDKSLYTRFQSYTFAFFLALPSQYSPRLQGGPQFVFDCYTQPPRLRHLRSKHPRPATKTTRDDHPQDIILRVPLFCSLNAQRTKTIKTKKFRYCQRLFRTTIGSDFLISLSRQISALRFPMST
jgi:hypothetical protein